MKHLTLILIVLLSIINLNAQITINGVVTDKHGNVLPGAAIEELHTTHWAIADTCGKFSITVNDTSKIRVTYLAYRDIVFLASKFKGDTIRMKPERHWFSEIVIPCGINPYPRSMSVGYYGDVNGMSYGFALSAFIPYHYKRYIWSIVSANIKTDFQSNTDIDISLAQYNIVAKSKYNLKAMVNYHYRDLSKNENWVKIDDYDIKTYHNLFYFVTICGGAGYRNNKTGNSGIYGILGIGKTIYRAKSSLSAELSIVEENVEYSLSLTQNFHEMRKYLRKLELGISYKNYVSCDELNFVLKYKFFL
jgi:hypothetical protein